MNQQCRRGLVVLPAGNGHGGHAQVLRVTTQNLLESKHDRRGQ